MTYLLTVHSSSGDAANAIAAIDGVLRVNNTDFHLFDRERDVYVTLYDRGDRADIDFCFGGPLDEVSAAINAAADLSVALRSEIHDPQIKSELSTSEADLTSIFESWKRNDRSVLLEYSKRNYYLRVPQMLNGSEILVEAIECHDPAQRPRNLARIGSALATATLWEDAVEVFEKARALASQDNEILWALIVTLANLERNKDAKRYLQELLKRQPDYPEARELLAQLS